MILVLYGYISSSITLYMTRGKEKDDDGWERRDPASKRRDERFGIAAALTDAIKADFVHDLHHRVTHHPMPIRRMGAPVITWNIHMSHNRQIHS